MHSKKRQNKYAKSWTNKKRQNKYTKSWIKTHDMAGQKRLEQVHRIIKPRIPLLELNQILWNKITSNKYTAQAYIHYELLWISTEQIIKKKSV